MTPMTFSLPTTHMTVLDDPRLGPQGWSVTIALADPAEEVEALILGRAARPEGPIEHLDVDLLLLDVANALQLPGLVWQFDVSTAPEAPEVSAEVRTARGPVSGMVLDLVRADDTADQLGLWVRWGPKASQSAMNAPDEMLPVILQALRTGGAPRRFALQSRDATAS